MKQFDVYPRYPVTLQRAEGCYVFDESGTRFLDLYGGHAVISIGHTHPHYVQAIRTQLDKIGFYSNSVHLPIQELLAEKLGKASGYSDYSLFLANSGAEANENALKLASFHTGKKKIIVFEKAFHGRTSLAVAATHNTKIQAPVNWTEDMVRLPWGDLDALQEAMSPETAAVLIEGIQGVGGIHVASDEFLQGAEKLCRKHGAVFILDEIQSGYGRSGRFFAHQHSGVRPDIIAIAKGMGNGFPIGGILIAPHFKAWDGMLGTTFGGNPLACAAALAVLEVMEKENLISHAHEMGKWLIPELQGLPGVMAVRGRGLMVGIDVAGNAKAVRSHLLNDHKIFTGTASSPETIRLLPPLNVSQEALAYFVDSLKKVLENETVSVS